MSCLHNVVFFIHIYIAIYVCIYGDFFKNEILCWIWISPRLAIKQALGLLLTRPPQSWDCRHAFTAALGFLSGCWGAKLKSGAHFTVVWAISPSPYIFCLFVWTWGIRIAHAELEFAAVPLACWDYGNLPQCSALLVFFSRVGGRAWDSVLCSTG